MKLYFAKSIRGGRDMVDTYMKKDKEIFKKGKLIVIEGTDGSGKATQVEILRKYYIDQSKDVFVVDFPQYDKPSSFFVQKYLRGEYGAADEVGTYRGSIFYALDRYDASFEVKQKLAEGWVVIANRYVSANMGHQAGKIEDLKIRDEYLDWLDNLEFNIFNIPRPDITLFLYVPPEIGQKLVDSKKAREYTKVHSLTP